MLKLREDLLNFSSSSSVYVEGVFEFFDECWIYVFT